MPQETCARLTIRIPAHLIHASDKVTNTDRGEVRQGQTMDSRLLHQTLSVGCLQVMDEEVKTSKNVTRSDLTAIVYQYSRCSREDAAEIVDAVFEQITSALASGQSVKLSGFGSFIPYSKNERIGRNPKTGVVHVIRPRTVVRFKPSITLRQKVAGT
jgi:integration host factor subunit alpha